MHGTPVLPHWYDTYMVLRFTFMQLLNCLNVLVCQRHVLLHVEGVWTVVLDSLHGILCNVLLLLTSRGVDCARHTNLGADQ